VSESRDLDHGTRPFYLFRLGRFAYVLKDFVFDHHLFWRRFLSHRSQHVVFPFNEYGSFFVFVCTRTTAVCNTTVCAARPLHKRNGYVNTPKHKIILYAHCVNNGLTVIHLSTLRAPYARRQNFTVVTHRFMRLSFRPVHLGYRIRVNGPI